MFELSIVGMAKAYKSQVVLNGLEFSCSSGNILGLMGRSGSGKSTLMKILFGALEADAGEVILDSKQVNMSRVNSGKRMAYLPQSSFLPKDISVWSAIKMYHPDRSVQSNLLRDPRVMEIKERSIRSLSYGLQRYLEVVLVVNLDRQLVLLDEPFSLIEPQYRDAVNDSLIRNKENKVIVITDHYYLDILSIADKKILIKEGKAFTIENEADLVKYGYIPKSKLN